MLVFALNYVVIGLVTACAAVAVHILRSERRGYRAFNYWKNMVLPNMKRISADQWTWSIAIWPIRVIQFIAISHVLYEAYEHERNKYGYRVIRGR